MSKLCKDCQHWNNETETCYHPKAYKPSTKELYSTGWWSVCVTLNKRWYEALKQ